MRVGDQGAVLPALVFAVGVGWGVGTAAAQPGAKQPEPGGSIELDRLGDPARLEQQLRQLLRAAPGVPLTIPGSQVRRGDFRLGSGDTLSGHGLVLQGNADLAGTVTGNLVVLDGDLTLRSGAVVRGDALVLRGRILDRGGVVRGERRSLARTSLPEAGNPGATGPFIKLAGLAGVVLTLSLLGFGLVLFAKPQLEVVSDTVTHSLFRSFLTGLLAQVVAIPTAGLLVVGLVLSVVGILLLPFVALVIPLLLAAAILIGFLAVTHAMGESHLRRRMAAGALVGSPNSYRYLLIGLGSVAVVWLGWIGFGWVPVAGALVFLVALVTTWVLATIGLGAFLLSRGGLRPAFTGQLIPPEALTDEYLWATPQFGVTAVRRPGQAGARTREP